jgi:hypothetical protein
MTTFKSCLYILVIGLVVATCVAQEPTKVTLSGTVIDPNKAVVPHAQITIKPVCQCSDCPDPQSCTCCPNQVAVVTDDAGNFRVSVIPGTYRVRAEVRGFKPQELTVTVNTQAEQHVRIQMQ